MPIGLDVRMDARVLAVTAMGTIVTALLFSVVPALRASRPDLVPALKGEEIAPVKKFRRLSLRKALVVSQLALSLLLLVCAGLFVRSLRNAEELELGIRKENTLLASMNIELQGYDETRGRAFFHDLIERARALPGVKSAAVGLPVPLDFFTGISQVIVEGRDVPPDKESVGVFTTLAGTDYFESIGTAILRGRGFSERDNESAPRVAVVNETFAKTYWPEQDPVGKRLWIDSREEQPLEVVGVAQDGKYRMYFEPTRPYLYMPFLQKYRGQATLVVHHNADPAALVTAVRREVAALDAELPLYAVQTVERFLEARTFLGPRLLSRLLGIFGVLGLTLAAVGTYGVMAYSVSQRTREIGIRMALGARPASVLNLVLRQGLTLAAIGLVLGVGGALGLTQLFKILLFGVSASDPLTYGGIALLLVAVAALACYVPARRAATVDPLKALRYE